MRTAVVVGNPKPASRTLTAATTAARLLSGDPDRDPDLVLDVVTLGPGLLGWGDPDVQRAVEQVASADLLVVASPTYKATYTGLLKLFLDQFAGGEGMRGVVAVPLMLGAGPAHALAPELLLKPVLAELGAACPAPGLYLLDAQVQAQGAQTPALAAYAQRWGATLRATAAAGHETRTAR
ncbi:NADPH-dependent oxidoreductase [Kineococcus sp. T13]|uniref:NAD(P)H-dependent oxidoreductase n=1 Tax=Kineococcus vitellinus TaxID=2696565 RepID=UPI001411F1BD|nr:NAD(P)H-dependent oxidoreductase [Kineococcus vitellinus]NAZ75048.1 NADPH-dependent oxidoreductase [Kineococcus vitellinus]